MEEKWFENIDNLTALARWLKDEGHWDGVGGVGNLIYFFGKPWKYDNEWNSYQLQLQREREDAKATR